MRIFLFLTLMLSFYSYAQNGHDHKDDTKKNDHEGARYESNHQSNTTHRLKIT